MDTETTDTAPSPAESAAAAGVLSGGDLPVTPGRGGTALAPAGAPTLDAQHSAVGKVFHGILGTLSGGGTEPSMDASGNITEAPVHRTGGDWARRLLAGALTGMASGAAAPIRPGGGAAAGIGAGFEGEERALGNQDAEKRQQLQQNFKNQQAKQQQDRETQTAADEGLLRKAQTALLTTQNVSAGFDLARKKAEASEESINAFNTFQKLVGADPANVDLGVFPDMNAVLAYRKLHPELTAQIAGGHDSGQIAAVPSFDENGVYNGVHAALVHPGMLDRPLAEVFPNPGDAPGFQYRVPGKMVNGKPGPDEWKTAAFAPGTKLGDALTMNQKSASDAATAKLRDVQIAHEEAATEGERAGTELKRRELSSGAPVDELGRPLPALDPDPVKSRKERLVRYDKFGKDYVKDANSLGQSASQLARIIADAKAHGGKLDGPGALVGVFDAVGISSAPLKGRGLRIGEKVIGSHITETRNIWDGMAVNLAKATPNGTGAVVSLAQLQGYARIIQDAQHDMYVTMAQEAERQGLPKDFLPKGNGAPIDAGTMKIFFDSYGGDANTAAQAAAKFGWSAPQ